MKTQHLLLCALLTLTSTASQAAAPRTAVPSGNVTVAFFEPENFTDFRDTMMGRYDDTTYADQLRDHLADQARRYVPAGQTLQITFTDIDMAGDFEPWRGIRWSDIRVVKDLYPPRVVFSFRLVDAEGNILKEGKRDLRELGFMMNASFLDNNDSLRHEKSLIDDWLRREFPRLPKAA